jgi:diguanylate cyclase (GGDEF)-like protein
VRERPVRRRVVLALRAALGLAVAGFAVAVVVRGADREQVPAVDVGLYCGAYLLGGTLLLLQDAEDRYERWAWRALGLGLFATTGGDAYYSAVLSQLADPPYPSPADGLYLLWYPAAYAAALLLVRSSVQRFYPSLVLDGLVAGLGAAAAVAAFVVQDLVEATGGSAPEVVVNLAYPVADLLLVLVLVAGGAVVGGGVTRVTAAVVAGLLLMACADVLYLLREAAGTYTEGGALDLLWLLGVLALVVAPNLRRARPPATPQEAPPADAAGSGAGATRRLDRRLVVLPLCAGCASIAFIGMGQVSPVPGTALLLADACVLAALTRLWLTLREMRRREEVELEHAHSQARTDELTGLANRRALLEHCDEVVPQATARHPVSVMLLDLDHFKDINDSLGHAGGDELLRQVAQRVRSALPPGDVVARPGGDEFAVVMAGTGSDAAMAAARTVRAVLAPPFVVDGIRLHVAASIGIATAPDPAATRSELLRLADIAMYEAKRGYGGVRAAGPLTRQATPDRLRTVDELCTALAQEDPARAGALVVHLQPQVRLAGGASCPQGGDGAAADPAQAVFDTVVGVEALVRWDHPVRGLLLPGAFLPLVESAGLTGALARRVVDLSLSACREWWARGHAVPVAVNLTAADLTGAGVPELVAEALERYGLPGRALVVELTEDTMMVDPLTAGQVLQRLRDLGVGISIDDYGTGYSSLAYLRDLSADELKLDRSFTAEMLTNSTTASIVRTTVDLAHSLGLRLVAEGIEDADCARALAALGCDVGQGHHIARPMPAAEMLPWLVARAARRPGMTPATAVPAR